MNKPLEDMGQLLAVVRSHSGKKRSVSINQTILELIIDVSRIDFVTDVYGATINNDDVLIAVETSSNQNILLTAHGDSTLASLKVLKTKWDGKIPAKKVAKRIHNFAYMPYYHDASKFVS